MKKNFYSFLSVLLLCVFFCAPFVFAATDVQAEEAHTTTLNLLNVRQNERGTGYEWNNKTNTLTLTNFRLETEERYGLRLPEKGTAPVTVVLVGNNYISASYAALDVLGSADFTGDGSLTLVGGEYGWINTATLTEIRVKIQSGTYTIQSEGVGVFSTRATWSVVGGTVKIESKGESVSAREIVMQGGSLTANGALHASYKLNLAYASVAVNAPGAALLSDKDLHITGIRLTSNGEVLSEYNGESAISGTPMSRARTTSMLFALFGMNNVPIAVDYLILTLAVLGIAALIVVPIIKKKKSLRLAKERYAAEEKARAEAEKEKRRAK